MMTNDSDKRTTDRTVSAAYRELANERAPAGLDEKILRRAAAPARARFGIGRAWMKPVAWAATLGLSLTIVLELTQLPPAPPAIDTVAPPAIDKLAPPPADERPASAPVSIEPATAKESRSTKPTRHRSEPGAVEEFEAPTMAPEMAPSPAPAPAAAKGQAATPEPEPTRPQALESTDLQLLEDGDTTADARSDEAAGTAAYAVPAKRMLLEQAALCPDTMREVPEDWYQCIEALRGKVSTQRIAREFEELRTRFPDFQRSDTE